MGYGFCKFLIYLINEKLLIIINLVLFLSSDAYADKKKNIF